MLLLPPNTCTRAHVEATEWAGMIPGGRRCALYALHAAYGHMRAIGPEALGPELNDFRKGKKFFGMTDIAGLAQRCMSRLPRLCGWYTHVLRVQARLPPA